MITFIEIGQKIIELVGGVDNIQRLYNCSSRVRLKIVDRAKVAPDSEFEKAKIQKIVNEYSIHLVYGRDSAKIAEQIRLFINYSLYTKNNIDIKFTVAKLIELLGGKDNIKSIHDFDDNKFKITVKDARLRAEDEDFANMGVIHLDHEFTKISKSNYIMFKPVTGHNKHDVIMLDIVDDFKNIKEEILGYLQHSVQSILGDDRIPGVAKLIIDKLGGYDNIKNIDNCLTRVRVHVREMDKVKSLGDHQDIYAMGIIKVDDFNLHLVYGTDSKLLKYELLKLIYTNY